MCKLIRNESNLPKPHNGFYINKTRLKRLWNDIIESISGTEKDFTEANLNKALLLLSIPMVLEMMMESVFAVVDIYFVSQLGSGAVAVVGITESFMFIVYAICGGIGTATTALVSRRIGEKNQKGASEVATQSIILGVIISLIISVIGIIFSKKLLFLMGATADVVEENYRYTKILLVGNIVVMLLFVINSIFRSAGDAALSMKVLFLGNIINIILDPCFIFGLWIFPEMGVAGAALATNIGRGCAVIFQFYLLFFKNHKIKITLSQIKCNFPIMLKILQLSAGGILQSIIATSSWIFMVRIINLFGKEVVAGYTIAIRIIIFSLLPSLGLSNAASTLVGQNLGAKKPDRAEKSVWRTSITNMLILCSLSIVFISYPHFFISLFISEQAVIDAGAICLRFISYGYLFYSFGMVIVQAFNGAGDTLTPTYINFFCFWLLEIPLAYLLAVPLNFQERGVYISILVAEGMAALIGVLMFRRGKWKAIKI